MNPTIFKNDLTPKVIIQQLDFFYYGYLNTEIVTEHNNWLPSFFDYSFCNLTKILTLTESYPSVHNFITPQQSHPKFHNQATCPPSNWNEEASLIIVVIIHFQLPSQQFTLHPAVRSLVMILLWASSPKDTQLSVPPPCLIVCFTKAPMERGSIIRFRSEEPNLNYCEPHLRILKWDDERGWGAFSEPDWLSGKHSYSFPIPIAETFRCPIACISFPSPAPFVSILSNFQICFPSHRRPPPDNPFHNNNM